MSDRRQAPPSVVALNEPGAFPAQRGVIPRAAQVPPPWQYKPDSGVDFTWNAASGQILAAVAGTKLVLLAVRDVTILPSYRGVIAGVTVFVTLPLGTMDISFSLTWNGAPVQGWDDIRPQPIAANGIVLTVPGTLQTPPGAAIGITVTNNANTGPWQVGGSIGGWQWSQAWEASTFGKVGGYN